MSCPGPFHVSYSVDYIYYFCPLPDPDVGLSIFVCDVEHTSFHFGLCGRKFVLCLFGQCPGLCTMCHSWQHTGVVQLSLQADGKFAFEDIPVFGVCRPACHDSSYVCMYIFIHQTWIYRNYTLIMKIFIYSVKISSPIGTISYSEVVDSAIIVTLGKYKIMCIHDNRPYLWS